eukprot:TRINITY_DN27742_c0_g1_i1.p1 TRINITY_DN27742_c0_g1~~TRINITY_DN27742_c0_g1_i1.p1  ORF type:complete len:151 (+),score=11.99 TRINITY_DN27742_c0_g1_i1:158-610(+)
MRDVLAPCKGALNRNRKLQIRKMMVHAYGYFFFVNLHSCTMKSRQDKLAPCEGVINHRWVSVGETGGDGAESTLVELMRDEFAPREGTFNRKGQLYIRILMAHAHGWLIFIAVETEASRAYTKLTTCERIINRDGKLNCELDDEGNRKYG